MREAYMFNAKSNYFISNLLIIRRELATQTLQEFYKYDENRATLPSVFWNADVQGV